MGTCGYHDGRRTRRRYAQRRLDSELFFAGCVLRISQFPARAEKQSLINVMIIDGAETLA